MLGIKNVEKGKWVLFYVDIDYSDGILMNVSATKDKVEFDIEKIIALIEEHKIGQKLHKIILETNKGKRAFYLNEIQPSNDIEAKIIDSLISGVRYLLRWSK